MVKQIIGVCIQNTTKANVGGLERSAKIHKDNMDDGNNLGV